MRGPLLAILVMCAGFYFGLKYLYSPEFQDYGDRNKAAWTCRVNNIMAELYVVMSKYAEAKALYERVVERCPETSAAETAEFNIAKCLDNMNYPLEAQRAYDQFVKNHPGSKRAKTAARAAQMVNQ